MLANRPDCQHQVGPVRGFTLLEVLVVLAILAVVIGLTSPAIQRARDAAARVGCASQLRQLALALHMHGDGQGELPAGCGYPFLRDPDRWFYSPGFSWQTSLLPYVEQDELAKRAVANYQRSPEADGAQHYAVMGSVVPVYLCPSESRRLGSNGAGLTWGLTSYTGVAGTKDVWQDGTLHSNFAIRLLDITDGTSNTLVIGETVPGPNGAWSGWHSAWGANVCRFAQIRPAGRNDFAPSEAVGCPLDMPQLRPGRRDNACDVTHFWSNHIGGANFAFADGPVRFLRYEASAILPDLATRAGGEVVGLP